jgi:membrane protease YdiL (CAAX protease family)
MESARPVTDDVSVEVYPAKVPWVAVVIFVVVSFGLAWLVTMPLWFSGGLASPLATTLLVVMMFTPAAAALFVVFLVQRPRPASIRRYLGLWPLRPAKRTIWMIVFAIFGSTAIVVAGAFLAAALGFVQLDLVNFSGFAAQIASLTSKPLPIPIQLVAVLQLVSIPAGALINAFFTIGEELGWRGWLLPSLRPLGTWPALLISGAIWGLWHSPVILLGYNFGEPNLLGVALMVGGCVLFGILVGWLRLRTGSIWPSVFAHAAFNAAGGFLVIVAVEGTSVSSPTLSPLGWVTWIVMALVIAVLVVTRQFGRAGSLSATAPRRPSHPQT